MRIAARLLLFTLALVLSAKLSQARIHHVCRDSTFLLNSLQLISNDSVPNLLNDGDTIYLDVGWYPQLTLIPDTMGSGFFWWIGEWSTCEDQTIWGEDTLISDAAGIYYYGDRYINFSFNVILIDFQKAKFEVSKNLFSSDEFIVEVPDIFAHYQWGNGDTTNYTTITSSGTYHVTIRDHCYSIFSRDITVELDTMVTAGLCDSSTMIYGEFLDPEPFPQAYSREYYLDIDGDGVDDIYYWHWKEQSGSHVWWGAKIRGLNDFFISVDQTGNIANRIEYGDNIGIKQHWKNDNLITVKNHIWEYYRPINCDIGWTYPEAGVFGIKKMDGYFNRFGWLKVNFLNGLLEISYALEKGPKFETRHYVCNDTIFYMDSDPGLILDSLPNPLYPDDTVYLMNGAGITIIPDIVSPEIVWCKYPLSSCAWENTYQDDTLFISDRGHYCYGDYDNHPSFDIYVQIIDTSLLNYEIEREIQNNGYILSVQNIFDHYSWSTGDTGFQINISEPGHYEVTAWDQCNNSYKNETEIAFHPEILAGVYNPEIMSIDTIFDTTTIWGVNFFTSRYDIDIDGDEIIDLEYFHHLDASISHADHIITLTSYNTTYLCMDPKTGTANVIAKFDDIGVKQHWVNDQILVIRDHQDGTSALCGVCEVGGPFIPGIPPYIGLKKISGNKEYYGWIEQRSDTIFVTMQTAFAGLKEISNLNPLIYPNPFTDHFNIEVDQIDCMLYLYDLNGELVFSHKIADKHEKIYPGNIRPGFYLGQLKGKENKTIFKILKMN